MTDESALVAAAQHGSEDAFTEIVEVYKTPVYNLCYRMLGAREAAEDAAQETFLRAFQHLHRYDQRRPFATWLLSIAAHYCIDRLRRRRLTFISMDGDGYGEGMELPDPAARNPEQESLRAEKKEQVHALLQELGTVDRAAVILRYWHDYSEAEIADSLHITVSAVKSRLHRARRELARLWQDEERWSSPARRPHESPAF